MAFSSRFNNVNKQGLFSQGGDLRRALTLEDSERITWWNKGKQVACDVASGLAFLHSNKIIHSEAPLQDSLMQSISFLG